MKVLLKHGTPAEISGYTGLEGELIVNDGGSMLYVTDGTTVGGHPINGIVYNVSKPSIIGPVDTSTGVSVTPIIQGSAFSGDGAHDASYWEVATDSGFTTIIHDSGRDTVNLLQYSLANASVTLEDLTTYYVRVRYETSYGVVSDYSNVVSFTTGVSIASTTEYVKLVDSTYNTSSSQFGVYVKLTADGNMLFVASLNTVNSTTGEIFVYVRNAGSWVFSQTLAPSNPSAKHGGAMILADNDTTLFTFNGKDVFIYNRIGNAWTFIKQLPNGLSTYTTNNRFGVSKNGERVALPRGSEVRVYTNDSGLWQNYVDLADPYNVYPNTTYTNKMAFSDDGSRLAVCYNTGDTEKGYVAVFHLENDVWVAKGKLVAPTRTQYDYFGYDAQFYDNGNKLAIVERYEASNIVHGIIHIFSYTGSSWIKTQSFKPSDAVTNDYINTIAINADGSKLLTGGRGGVYLFTNENDIWVQHGKYTADNVDSSDKYGDSVSLSDGGDVIAIGAYADDDVNTNAGAVYIFS